MAAVGCGVPGEGSAQLFRDPVEQLDQRGEDRLGGVVGWGPRRRCARTVRQIISCDTRSVAPWVPRTSPIERVIGESFVFILASTCPASGASAMSTGVWVDLVYGRGWACTATAVQAQPVSDHSNGLVTLDPGADLLAFGSGQQLCWIAWWSMPAGASMNSPQSPPRHDLTGGGSPSISGCWRHYSNSATVA